MLLITFFIQRNSKDEKETKKKTLRILEAEFAVEIRKRKRTKKIFAQRRMHKEAASPYQPRLKGEKKRVLFVVGGGIFSRYLPPAGRHDTQGEDRFSRPH